MKKMDRKEEEGMLKDVRYGKKARVAHTLTHEELAILTAQPTTEEDKTVIKWPKIKWIRKTGKTEFRQQKRFIRRRSREHLLDKIALQGRELNRCEGCNELFPSLDIHHIDGNPHNNDVDNLLLLCKECHGERHKIAVYIGTKRWWIGTVAE